MNKSLREAVLQKLVFRDGVVYRATASGLKPLPFDDTYVETKVSGMKLKTTLPRLCYFLQTKEWQPVVDVIDSKKPMTLDNLVIGKQKTLMAKYDCTTHLTSFYWKDGSSRKQKTIDSSSTEEITNFIQKMKEYKIKYLDK